MIKIILFDFDGTIADSFENYLTIIDELSKKYRLPTIPRSEIETLRDDDARTIIKKLKIPFFKIPFIARDMKKIQRNKMHEIYPFSDIPQLLQSLTAKGYLLGILSSNGKQNVELFLKKNSIDIFTYIQTDVGIFGKDTALKNLLKKHHFTKDDVLYIGDEIRDIQACKKMGIKIVSVTWGFNSKNGLKKYNPDFLIDSPLEVLKILETHAS